MSSDLDPLQAYDPLTQKQLQKEIDKMKKSTPDAQPEPAPSYETETVETLSFHDIWQMFQQRKRDYLKRFKKRPTGVFVGRIEGGVLAANREALARKNLVRMETIGGKQHLFINNMLMVISAQETCIMPFHAELDQLGTTLLPDA